MAKQLGKFPLLGTKEEQEAYWEKWFASGVPFEKYASYVNSEQYKEDQRQEQLEREAANRQEELELMFLPE